jgi:phosphatidylglycerophosphate synthase
MRQALLAVNFDINWPGGGPKEYGMESFKNLSELFSALPGELKTCVYLAVGLVIVVAALAIPRSILEWIGAKRFLSPNWISIWRLPVFYIGAVLYWSGFTFAGYCVVVFAFAMDRLDGKVADVLEEKIGRVIVYPEQIEGEKEWRYKWRCWKVALNHPGRTKEGASLDPLIDKLTVIPMMAVFAFKGILSPYLIVAMVLAEAAGTLIRPPFDIAPQYVRSGRATFVGKIKFLLHGLTLIGGLTVEHKFLVFPRINFRWFETSSLNLFLFVVLVLSVLSVFSRLDLGKKLNRLVDALTSTLFGHSVQRK